MYKLDKSDILRVISELESMCRLPKHEHIEGLTDALQQYLSACWGVKKTVKQIYRILYTVQKSPEQTTCGYACNAQVFPQFA